MTIKEAATALRSALVRRGIADKALIPELRLDTDLGLDSLAFVRLVMDLEEATGLAIPDALVATVETVGELLAVLTEIRVGA